MRILLAAALTLTTRRHWCLNSKTWRMNATCRVSTASYLCNVCVLSNYKWLFAFSALTLLAGWQKGHPACKNWVVGCWRGYLPGARCRLAYGPADATVSCFSKIQIGFIFLVSDYPGSPGKRAVNECVHVCNYKWLVECERKVVQQLCAKQYVAWMLHGL